MSSGPGPTMRRRRLGAELRRLREAAGLTGDQVIERVGWASASKLSRLENGRSRPDLGDVLDLLDLYQISGRTREELVSITREAGNTRGWLRAYPVMTRRQRAYAELETGCTDIREYGPALVPGLLQTPEYARVRILSARPLLADAAPGGDCAPDVEVAARVARQAILTRETQAPTYEAVLEETALTGRGGPPEVMRAQLAHLCQLAQLPNVTLRVLPRDTVIADWYVPYTAFSLYRFADPADPETVAVEALGTDLVRADAATVRHHARVFDWLSGAALSPADSLVWLGTQAGQAPVAPAPTQRRRTPEPRPQPAHPES